MDNPTGETSGTCTCKHHKMMPVFVILFGLLFLGGTLEWWSMNVVNMGWPVVVIAAGLMKMMEGKCKCC